MGRVKIKPADEIFSLYIRCRDGWKCKRCGRYDEPPSRIITNSHFWNRGNSCTRFDEENCIALCLGCHTLWESEKQSAYMDYMLNWLGQKGYDDLKVRAHLTCKRSDEESKALLVYTMKLKKEYYDEYPAIRPKVDKYIKRSKI